jgi:hypothetical protein
MKDLPLVFQRLTVPDEQLKRAYSDHHAHTVRLPYLKAWQQFYQWHRLR